MAVTKEQYQAALDVLHEALPMQLQKCDKKTEEWKNIGSCVRGKEAAYAALHALKAKSPDAVLRVVPKNEADRYRQGYLDCLARFTEKAKRSDERPKRRPQMYMPDNL